MVLIYTHKEFERQFKRLRKKYSSLVTDFLQFRKELEETPMQGVDLGNGVRKMRMAITSKGKGRSGGARIITFNVSSNEDGNIIITLLTIYDKNEISTLSDEFIKSLVESV